MGTPNHSTSLALVSPQVLLTDTSGPGPLQPQHHVPTCLHKRLGPWLTVKSTETGRPGLSAPQSSSGSCLPPVQGSSQRR